MRVLGRTTLPEGVARLLSDCSICSTCCRHASMRRLLCDADSANRASYYASSQECFCPSNQKLVVVTVHMTCVCVWSQCVITVRCHSVWSGILQRKKMVPQQGLYFGDNCAAPVLCFPQRSAFLLFACQRDHLAWMAVRSTASWTQSSACTQAAFQFFCYDKKHRDTKKGILFVRGCHKGWLEFA